MPFITYFEYFIIFYAAAINSVYFVLIVLGYFAVRDAQRLSASELETLSTSPLLPSISVLAPAYNESVSVRDSVRAMLGLNYPNHEVVVINDGSKDDTLEVLIEHFRLYKSSRVPGGRLSTKPIRAIYESRDAIRLIVVDKESGGKADSLNVGLNVSRSELVAAVDSDSLLEKDSLLHVTMPFLTDDRTIATGGIVRVANGCKVENGRISEISISGNLLARFQVIEYLRAFLGGRIAFSFLNSLLIISGAFGLLRREAVISAGGFEAATVGEDMELVVRLHRIKRQKKEKYRIVFVSDPVCWTQVPETLRVLHRQRNRWQRGSVESLWFHRRIFMNPRFGVLGLFAVPYFVAFEVFGPVVEMTGYISTIFGLALGVISHEVAALFFITSVAFGMLLSISSILLEQFTVRRYPAARDVLKLLWVAVLENFGFRQLLTFWRTQGVIDVIRRKKSWGAMERRGFGAKSKALYKTEHPG
jgi:cellulose synthase/poly-beta-1,6-N-acetylglucosamine synthase-like glycosyltransferase